MRKLRTWKGADLKWIRENWQKLSDKEMAEHFGVTTDVFTQQRRRLGLKRPVNFTHLKGNKPPQWNAHKKGKPWWGVMAGKPLEQIMVYPENGPRVRMSYTRYLWIQKNGPVPDGYTIAAVNGDINDRSEGNIICVTRAEVGRMTMARRPKALRQMIRAKQIQTLRVRRKVRAYTEHKPYPLPA